MTVLLVLTCAYVAYSVEHSVNTEFANYGDSVWWAVVTITTVGYGDITPITTTGRITAVILMLSGVGLLGVLAGTLSSFFGFGQPRDADKNKATGATAFAAPVIPSSEMADLRGSPGRARPRVGRAAGARAVAVASHRPAS